MCTGTHGFIPAENTAKLAMYFDTSGGKSMNITHWRREHEWDPALLALLIADVATYWEANFSPLQASSIECTRMVATDLSHEAGYEVDMAPPTDLSGGNVSPAMPGNVTITTKFGTGLAGRSQRGRSYFVGLCENQCAGDFAQAGLTDQITDAWTDLVGGVHDGDTEAKLAIVSYCSEGVWRTNAQVTDVNSFTTEGTLDSMRSRLAGRGI
jgi:hypothetical protein